MTHSTLTGDSRLIGCLLALLAASHSAMAADPPASTPPGIVLIVADDLGFGDVGCYGCPDIQTPTLDSLSRDGVRFTQFYANAPECSPTRTALMTGRYQQRVGGLECAIGTGNVGRYDDAIRLRETHDLGLPADLNALVRAVKGSGYATACIGKWHLGYEPKFFPLQHGFEYAFGPLGGGVDYFHHTESDGAAVLYLNGKRIDRDGYMTDLITDEAVHFIERQSAKPFFLYVPYTAPHTPYQGPNDRNDKPVSAKAWNEGTRRTYIKMVERLDHGVSCILSALDRKGIARNTLVIFCSDNGAPELGRNAPFSGYKSGLFEGGIRVPCLIRWPGVLRAGVHCHQPTLTMDLAASIIRIAGAPTSARQPLDGIDIIQTLQSGRPPIDRNLFWRERRGDLTWGAVRSADLKYISRQEGSRIEEYLFDLRLDPGEKENLVRQRPDDMQRLKQLLTDWEADVRPMR